jgi:NADH-quinone oxidoreductase subunit N
LAAGYYLRLAFTASQRPIDEAVDARIPAPQVGVAVGAALLFAVAATLVLGIIPGDVLHATESGAHTLQAPPMAGVPLPVSASQSIP